MKFGQANDIGHFREWQFPGWDKVSTFLSFMVEMEFKDIFIYKSSALEEFKVELIRYMVGVVVLILPVTMDYSAVWYRKDSFLFNLHYQ